MIAVPKQSILAVLLSLALYTNRPLLVVGFTPPIGPLEISLPPGPLPSTLPSRVPDCPVDVHGLGDLFSWLNSKGYKGGKCDVAVFEGGLRGVLASEAIKAEDPLVVVPWDACLAVRETDEEPPADAEYASVAVGRDVWVRLTREERLACRLMQERALGPRSQYWEYIKMLPESFPDQPLLWRQREIEALGYPEVWRAIEAQRGEVDRLASLLLQPSSSWVTRPVLVWALLCVYSRACNVDMPWEGREGSESVLALLPGFDLFNHQCGEAHSPLSSCGDRRAFVLHAGRAFDRGTQVLINYGDRCNDELLLSYGFSVEGNPDDTYVMRSPAIRRLLVQEENGPITGGAIIEGPSMERLQLLRRLGLERQVTQVVLSRGWVSEGALRGLRLLLASEDELLGSGVLFLGGGALDRPLSFACEVRVWDVLAQAIDEELTRLLGCTQTSQGVEGCSRWMRTPAPAAAASSSRSTVGGRQSRWLMGKAEGKGKGAQPLVRRAIGVQRRQLIDSYVRAKVALLSGVRDNVRRRKEASLQQGGLVA